MRLLTVRHSLPLYGGIEPRFPITAHFAPIFGVLYFWSFSPVSKTLAQARGVSKTKVFETVGFIGPQAVPITVQVAQLIVPTGAGKRRAARLPAREKN